MGRERKNQGVFEREKGSGIWWVEWWDGPKRYRRRVGPSKEIAISLAEQMRARVRVRRLAPELVDEPQKPRTLAEAIAHHLDTNTNRTRRDDQRSAALWKKAFPGRMLQEITTAQIEKWRTTRLRSGRAPATCNRELSFLRKIYNIAVRERWCAHNPVGRELFLRVNNVRTQFVSEQEEEHLRPFFHPDAWLLVEFAIQTGMRQHEQFYLRREHVNLPDRVAMIPESKDGQARPVWLSSRAVEILQVVLARHSSPWVFPSRNRDTPIGPRNFYNRVFCPSVALAAEVPGWEALGSITWHTLRHTFGSRLAQRGVPLFTIQKLMGHKDPKTTQRYAHLAAHHELAAVEIMAQEPTATRTATDVLRKTV